MSVDFGIEIEGKHGKTQIDSKYGQLVVIEKGTIPGLRYWIQDQSFSLVVINNGYHARYGHLIPIPDGETHDSIFVFAKPNFTNYAAFNIAELALEWVDLDGDGTIDHFEIYVPMQYYRSSSYDRLTVDYVVCSIDSIDDGYLGGENNQGLHVRNQYGNLVFSSNRENFIGEQSKQADNPKYKYLNFAAGHAAKTLANNLKPDPLTDITIYPDNQHAEGFEDYYAFMNPTASLIAWQSMGLNGYAYGDCLYFNFIKWVTPSTRSPTYRIEMTQSYKWTRGYRSLSYESPGFQWNIEKVLLIGKFR